MRSVANLTRQDGEDFFALAAEHPLRTEVTPFALWQANEALAAVREGRIEGAAVLDLTGMPAKAGPRSRPAMSP